MSTGYGEGEGRVKRAIDDALNSPLLNDNDIFNAKKILLNISFCSDKSSNNGLMMEEMNDVNDFMARFGSDFEIKWGLATDPELGDKVKVTILSTGFGIENVDGMNNHVKKHTAEENERRAAEEERAAERRAKREHYYGNDGKNSKYKRRPHIYIFRQEDLDNDDVISSIESTPTYKRTRQELEEIRKQSTGHAKSAPDAEEKKISGTIKF